MLRCGKERKKRESTIKSEERDFDSLAFCFSLFLCFKLSNKMFALQLSLSWKWICELVQRSPFLLSFCSHGAFMSL